MAVVLELTDAKRTIFDQYDYSFGFWKHVSRSVSVVVAIGTIMKRTFQDNVFLPYKICLTN
eukprot:scaffold265_cov131-Cylindrotheca_fusiformis.AAC.14